MKFCPNCGTRLEGEKFCPKCQWPNPGETDSVPRKSRFRRLGAVLSVTWRGAKKLKPHFRRLVSALYSAWRRGRFLPLLMLPIGLFIAESTERRIGFEVARCHCYDVPIPVCDFFEADKWEAVAHASSSPLLLEDRFPRRLYPEVHEKAPMWRQLRNEGFDNFHWKSRLWKDVFLTAWWSLFGIAIVSIGVAWLTRKVPEDGRCFSDKAMFYASNLLVVWWILYLSDVLWLYKPAHVWHSVFRYHV